MDVYSKRYIGKGHSLKSLYNRAYDVTLKARKTALEKHCLSCCQDKGGGRGGRVFQIKSHTGTESPGLKKMLENAETLKKKHCGLSEGIKESVEQDVAGESKGTQRTARQGC